MRSPALPRLPRPQAPPPRRRCLTRILDPDPYRNPDPDGPQAPRLLSLTRILDLVLDPDPSGAAATGAARSRLTGRCRRPAAPTVKGGWAWVRPADRGGGPATAKEAGPATAKGAGPATAKGAGSATAKAPRPLSPLMVRFQQHLVTLQPNFHVGLCMLQPHCHVGLGMLQPSCHVVA